MEVDAVESLPHLVILYCLDGVKTYTVCSTETAVFEHFFELYENVQINSAKERHKQPSVSSGAQPPVSAMPLAVQYDAADLLNFIDFRVSEIAIFSAAERPLPPDGTAYRVVGRRWLKEHLYSYLRSRVHPPLATAPSAR